MIYFLKTSNKCNNNCTYCDSLHKKHRKEKKLADIKKEIDNAYISGFTVVKFSCNTDCRSDFLKILQYSKKKKFKIILETNARVFYYSKQLKISNKFIDNYEVFFSFGTPKKAKFINEIKDGFFEQSILGFRNIVNLIGERKIVAKIVILNHNIEEIKRVIRNVVSLGVLKIEFILPFNITEKQKISPSISGMTKVMPKFLEYASQLGAEIKFCEELEYNPFKTNRIKLLNEKLSSLKFKKRIFSQKPKISIIIPTRNKNKHLKPVLESFFSQNIEKSDYEIIIVNDGGDKHTEQMIRALKIKCNLRYIYWPRTKHKKNQYISKFSNFYNRAGLARNIGVDNAKGDLLLFSDDDIIVMPDNLKYHLSKHKNNQNLILRGFRKNLPKNFLPKKYSHKIFDSHGVEELNLERKIEKCKKYEIANNGWENFVTCNLSMSKKLFLEAGKFKNDSPFWGLEDVELGYRLRNHNPVLNWDSDLIVYHLWHEPQTINEEKKIMIFWINTNIFYRKYFDSDIYKIYLDTIVNNLDNNIFR